MLGLGLGLGRFIEAVCFIIGVGVLTERGQLRRLRQYKDAL